MAVIGKKKKKGVPETSTASLPDIIFTLLFFFMVSAKVKDSTLKVDHTMPRAVEVKKLTSDDKPATIHVGVPLPQYRDIYGSEPRIQLQDQISDVDDIQEWVLRRIQELPRNSRPKFLVNLKADGEVPYKLIDQIKIELRKAEALRLNYDARSLSYSN